MNWWISSTTKKREKINELSGFFLFIHSIVWNCLTNHRKLDQKCFFGLNISTMNLRKLDHRDFVDEKSVSVKLNEPVKSNCVSSSFVLRCSPSNRNKVNGNFSSETKPICITVNAIVVKFAKITMTKTAKIKLLSKENIFVLNGSDSDSALSMIWNKTILHFSFLTNQRTSIQHSD